MGPEDLPIAVQLHPTFNNRSGPFSFNVWPCSARQVTIYSKCRKRDIEEVLDRDREKKIVGAEYADKRRHAQPTQIELGDVVVAKRMVRDNKLSSNFNPEELQVVGRNGSDVTLKSSVSGKVFHRNVTHVKKVTPSSDENIEDRVDSSENRRAQNDPIELSAHGRPRRESRTPGYLNEYQLGLVEDY